MLDVREILKALDPQDRLLWSQHRTEMRRSYLNAHNTTVGVIKWDMQDDALLDLIDIRIALLFDRAGRFDSVKEVAAQSDSERIEAELHRTVDRIKQNVEKNETSANATPATKLMQNSWQDQHTH